MTFAPIERSAAARCLGQRADGTLLGCGANWQPDFKAVARSRDGGATWEKVWRFVELAGAAPCADGTVQHDTCECSRCGRTLQAAVRRDRADVRRVQTDAHRPAIRRRRSQGRLRCGGRRAGLGVVAFAIVALLLLRRRRRAA